MKKFVSNSPEESKKIAQDFAKEILADTMSRFRLDRKGETTDKKIPFNFPQKRGKKGGRCINNNKRLFYVCLLLY